MENGRIVINYSRCVGCKICMNICSFTHEGEFNPHSARLYIYMDPFTGEVEGEVGVKCDLCGGRPKCVEWCPMAALRYSKK
jgi:anaerobic carbon-monoxide dehydrogenase iron sulfur subunit